METNELTLFVRAAALGNITHAAAELGYTQSAASHALRKLEKELGVTLFQRLHNGVQLTEGGRRLLPDAQRLTEDSETLLRSAASLRSSVSGTLCIGCISSVAIRWMPVLTEGFSRRYPQVSLRFMDGAYSEIEHWISEKKVDAGFLSSATKRDFRLIPLREDPMMVVLPKGDPLCACDEIPLHALRDRRILIPAEGPRYDVGIILRSAGLGTMQEENIVSDYSALSLVGQGQGITILPRLLLVGHTDPQLVLRPLESRPSRTICLAVLPHRQLSPAAEAFCRYVTAWADENREN